MFSPDQHHALVAISCALKAHASRTKLTLFRSNAEIILLVSRVISCPKSLEHARGWEVVKVRSSGVLFESARRVE